MPPSARNSAIISSQAQSSALAFLAVLEAMDAPAGLRARPTRPLKPWLARPAPPSKRSMLGARLPELEHELVRMAADRFVEDLDGQRVLRITQDRALALVDEAGFLELLLDELRIDAVQGFGLGHARAGFAAVGDDDEHAAGLQSLVGRAVQHHRVDRAQELVRIVMVVMRCV